MPLELILDVFSFLDSLKEAENLIFAAPIFLHSWRRRSAVPHAAIVAHSTLSYPEALRIAVIQEENPGVEGDVPGRETVVARHTRVLSNARVVSLAFGLFRDRMQSQTDPHIRIKPASSCP